MSLTAKQQLVRSEAVMGRRSPFAENRTGYGSGRHARASRWHIVTRRWRSQAASNAYASHRSGVEPNRPGILLMTTQRKGVAGGFVRTTDTKGHIRPLADIEAEIVRLAVRRYGKTEAARRLRIGRSTLWRKLRGR